MAENDSCIKRSAIILTAFALFFVTWYFNLGVRPFANLISGSKSLHYILNYLIASLIPAAALSVLHKPGALLRTLGLTHRCGRGLLFGMLCTTLEAFGVTAAGSIFFCWIYVESGNNLWSVIWLHTLMNAPWMLFRVSDSGAVGGLWANGLRLCTLLLAIALVVIFKKRNGLPYFI